MSSVGRSRCPGGQIYVADEQWLCVACFQDRSDADAFQAALGGERFDPAQRGRGKRWRKPAQDATTEKWAEEVAKIIKA